MRISETVSITLPPDMLARAKALAKEESRSMSELIREALRKYEFEKSLRKLQNSPSAKATRKKLWAKYGSEEKIEEAIVQMVKEVRKTAWPEYKKKMGWNKPSKKA